MFVFFSFETNNNKKYKQLINKFEIYYQKNKEKRRIRRRDTYILAGKILCTVEYYYKLRSIFPFYLISEFDNNWTKRN